MLSSSRKAGVLGGGTREDEGEEDEDEGRCDDYCAVFELEPVTRSTRRSTRARSKTRRTRARTAGES